MSLRTDILIVEERGEGIIVTILSFLFSLLVILLVLVLLTVANIEDYDFFELVKVAFFDIFIDPNTGDINTDNILNVVYYSTPLVLTGLSVGIAFRAGLFNIGGQGQLIMGGTFAAIWGAALAPDFIDNPILMLPSIIFIGILAGAIWGFIPGLLKAYTGAHEVITTIMMNLIAISFSLWLINNPFLNTELTSAYATTNSIKISARVPPLFDHDLLNWTIVLVIMAVVFAHFLLYKTNLGYKIRAVGFSPSASEAAGINSKRTTVIAMTIAGAFAGLAGTITVIGVPNTFYRWSTGQGSSYGFDGIAVSLIGQNSPFPIIFGALLFGLLIQGGLDLQRTQIPPEIVSILQSAVILFVAAPLIARTIYRSRKRKLNQDIVSSFNLSKWISQNRASIYSLGIVILIPVLILINNITLNINLLSIFTSITALVPIFMDTMPLVSTFVLIMPFAYGGRKFVQYGRRGTIRRREERSFIKTIGLAIIGLIVVIEVFVLGLYLVNSLLTGFTNPLTFHAVIWEEFFKTSTLKRAFVLGIPIMLAAMGGTFNERAGVINIGLEGIMLMAAFGATYFSLITGDPFVGLVGGVFAGMLLALLHGIWSITFKGEQIVAGVAINLLALGLTDLFLIILDANPPTLDYTGGPGFSAFVANLPFIKLSDIPILGEIFQSLRLENFVSDFDFLKFVPDPFVIIADQSVLLIAGLALIPICHYLLFNTTFGLRIRVIGEDPQTAATAGIPVRLYQYAAVLFSGFLAALGGVYLSIGDLNIFSSNMTGGKGFIALAATIVGKWTIIGSALAGLFFGYFDSLKVGLDDLAQTSLPTEFFTILPFIVLIFVLSGFIGRARPPKNIGKPYDPSED